MMKLRKEGKPCTLTDSRIKKLESVGFVWRAQGTDAQLRIEAARRKPAYDARWEHYFNELCKYKEAEGHCMVPKRFSNTKLSSW